MVIFCTVPPTPERLPCVRTVFPLIVNRPPSLKFGAAKRYDPANGVLSLQAAVRVDTRVPEGSVELTDGDEGFADIDRVGGGGDADKFTLMVPPLPA
jgi:hypothetical protein